MKLKEVALEWLEYKQKFVKLSTYAYYRIIVDNYIIPSFGDLDIEDFKEETIQQKVLQWQMNGNRNNSGLKVSTIKNMLMILKQCMRYAQKTRNTGWIDMSIHYAVVDNLPVKKVFDDQTQKRIILSVLSDFSTRSLGIIIAINCGIRIGELCALQWKDLDFENGILSISKTLQRIYIKGEYNKSRIIITSPKTASSIREIPLSKGIIELIKKVPIVNDNYYVLTNNMNYIEPRTYRSFYKKFLQRHGIENLKFHSLRHTFATSCIQKGGDIKSVSDLLGHSTVTTTLNMYVHPGVEEKRRCIELLKWEV